MDPNSVSEQLELQTALMQCSAIAQCFLVGIVLFIVVLATRKQKDFWCVILLCFMPLFAIAEETEPSTLISDSQFNANISDSTTDINTTVGYDPSVVFEGYDTLSPTTDIFTFDFSDVYGINFGVLELGSGDNLMFDSTNERNIFKSVISLFVTLFFVSKVWTTLRQY